MYRNNSMHWATRASVSLFFSFQYDYVYTNGRESIWRGKAPLSLTAVVPSSVKTTHIQSYSQLCDGFKPLAGSDS